MAAPKSSATVLALAELADLSAKKLEDGHSVDDVIALLRKAAETVRSTLKPAEPVQTAATEQEAALDQVESTLREIETISA